MKNLLSRKLPAVVAGGILTCLLLFYLLGTGGGPKVVTLTLDLPTGGRYVTHQHFSDDNPLISVANSIPGVAQWKIILAQKNAVHLLIHAKSEGESRLVLAFENGDRRILEIRVSDEASAAGCDGGGIPQDSADELMEKAANRFENRRADPANCLSAVRCYEKAESILKRDPFYAFAPEYRILWEKKRSAKNELENLHRDFLAKLETGERRDDAKSIQESLLFLTALFSNDPNSEEYLTYKTILDYR